MILAGASPPPPPNHYRIAVCLKCLLALGAVLLLAGVLLNCWAELSTASWIVEASSKPPVPPSTPEDYERAEEWFVLIKSEERQHFWAGEVLLPLGLGMLLGALAGFALLPTKRFRLSTLLIAVLYVALLLGLPCGLVRPRLQNPRLWYQSETGDFAFSQSAPNKHNREFQSRSKFLILKRKSIPVALFPVILIPVAVFLIRRRHPVPQRGNLP
jgi:hypothetical protein